MKIREIQAASIFVRSKLPDADYVVNPYTGCQFGCQYCYASFMGRFVGEPIENWGEYVYVKVNAVELAQRELDRWSHERRTASVLLSSVTDPYHGIERKYGLTRGILGVLAREQYQGLVGILTKSPMVLRDVDILQQLPNVEVGMTITTTDDRLSRLLECRAPLASRRLQTLAGLHAAGLPVYAFVGPLLPHFRYRPDLLDTLFAKLREAGVDSVYVEHINLKQYIKKRLLAALERERPEVRRVYEEASTEQHRAALQTLVVELLSKHRLRLRMSEVLYHPEPART